MNGSEGTKFYFREEPFCFKTRWLNPGSPTPGRLTGCLIVLFFHNIYFIIYYDTYLTKPPTIREVKGVNFEEFL